MAELSSDAPTVRGRSALSTLQGKITAVAMITAVAVLLAACAVFTAEQWRAERQWLERSQAQLAGLMTPPLARALEANDVDRAQAALDNLKAFRAVQAAEVLDSGGRTVARYRRVGGPPRGDATLIHSRSLILQNFALGREPVDASAPPTLDGSKPLGVLVIHREVGIAGEFLARYTAVAAALFFAAAGLSLFLGRAMARRVAEPINQLSEAMRDVAAHSDFARRVKAAADDDLGRLTMSFNDLLARLQENDRELRRTLAELTQARDAAQAANVQKSQFMANISHEIRTPLNGVLAMAQIMALGDMAEEQRERLTVIRKSGEALLEILNDILDVSKIEAGKLELDAIEFDLESVVHGARDGFVAVAQRKNLNLQVEVSDTAWGGRLGDPARLRQIISNLISNALKFTVEGEVVVSVTGVGENGSEGIAIAVRDTGIGMPAGKIPMLFQKFTQLDASTTRQFGGTGLGLAICHELSTLMGGRIWAESEEGRGSTFHVELPLPRMSNRRAETGNEDELPEDQGRVLRVLAAEDNPTNQMVLTTILQIFGAEMELVDNGQAAVQAWAAGDYDVILMDIQMPVMDGIAATREIRRLELEGRVVRTPIIALSANAMVHQIKEYMAAGMDGHVAKPIELPKLHAALEAALAARMAAVARAA